MRVGVFVVVCLLVAACSGQVRRPPANEATRIPENGNWFCQLAPGGAGWECVQDPALAEHPAPERLPHPPAPTAPDAVPPPGESLTSDPSEDFGAQSPAEAPGAEPASDDARPPSNPPPAAERPPVADSPPAPDELPEYLRRAYQPPAPVSLMELPPDLYAVQVLAMNSREEIDAFVRRHRLQGLSSARVANDGRIYFVLLLGIYEDLATARAILADLPPPFDPGDVWIRPLGSLQAAIAKADSVARSGRP